MQYISKIIFTILGTIIGAGFISGQEIYLFFNKYGSSGIIGIIISGIIIGLVIKKTFIIIKEKNINNYKNFTETIIPTENKYIKLIINNIISMFLLISFFIMCAALNSFFKQEFNIPVYIIGFLNCILCYIILNNNNKLVIKINKILIPIILILVFYLKIKNNINFITLQFNINKEMIFAILNGIIYASYNSILLIPILITLNKFLINKKQIKKISFITSLIIIILSLILFLLIYNLKNIEQIEIPLIYIANSYGDIYYYIYSLVILFAIFTTEILVGYGFINNINIEKNKKIIILILGILSIFISYIGFSNLVSLMYPIFGIIGIIQIFFILRY